MAIKLPPPPIQDNDLNQNWKNWFLKVKDLLTGVSSLSWSLIDFTNSKITDILDRKHNDLQSIQGGTTNEYYHLTSANYTDLTDSGDSTLHYHSSDRDSDNFTGTEWDDLTDSGYTTLHKHEEVYGEMYVTNTTITVTVSASNTAYEVDNGLTGGELSGITFPSDYYLQVPSDGKYHIFWSMSIDTSFVLDEAEGGIMLNGTASEKGTGHTTVQAGNSAGCISGSLILACSTNDTISLYVRNHTAARDITVEHASVTIRKLF